MRKNFETIKAFLTSYSKKYIFSVFLFLIVFSIIKIISFATPVILSNFTTNQEDYGYFEYIISIGSIASIIMNTGFSGSYPYFTLRLNRVNFRSNFYFHIFWSLFITFFSIILLYFNLCSEKITFILMIGSIISIQSLLSVICKTHEKIVLAVLLDAGIYLLLMLYVGYLFFFNNYLSLTALKSIFVFQIFLLSIVIVTTFFLHQKYFSWEKYKEIFKYASPLVISSFLIIALTGSTRIFIEYFLGLKDVGTFSFYFRLASIVIMIHQAVNIVFFSNMYRADSRKLDFFFSIFICGISLISVALLVTIPYVGMPYLKVLRETYHDAYPIFILLSFQMLFWISNALNENVIYRENMSREMNFGFLWIILAMITSMFILHSLKSLPLSMIIFINAFALYISTEVQFWALSKKGILFNRNRNLNRILALGLVLLYIITL